MKAWSYSPRYVLLLRQSSGVVWSISTLQSAQCLLVTGQGVGQATFTLADPTGFLRKTVQPRPMNLAQLWLLDKEGFSGVAWTGYVDEAHQVFDPDQGAGVALSCSSPVKLFEITRQSPADVANLAVAYAQNATGSSVLKYAAQACGYPPSLLRIHPVADSGSGYQQIGADVFTSPNQQSWSAVVAAIQANSGTEWWFNELGHCYYRQIGFWDPWFSTGLPGDPARPAQIRSRTITDDDILGADLFQSDQGIVTDVEVRYYGGGGLTQTAVHWPRSAAAGGPPESAAHKSMVAHLRTRRQVIYAPWITNSAAAQYLADVLGAQYSAGVAQGSVTIPATPAVALGSLVDVPARGSAGHTRYYVSSITYQLNWPGSWAMTLGLTYGRAPDQSFPYTDKVSWPALTSDVRAGEALPSPIASLDAANPAWDTSAYTIVAQAGLRKDRAATAAYPPGAVIQIYAKPRSQGGLLGPAPTGEYTVIAPTNAQQSATTIALASTKQATGYVTIISLAPPAVVDAPTPAVPGFAALSTTQYGTGSSTADDPADPGAQPAGPAATVALRALQQALTRAKKPFDLGHAGDDAWDCSGLVAWSYAQLGIGTGPSQMFFAAPGNGKAWNTDSGPAGIWRFMKSIGATETDVTAAQQGDLLFCQDSDGGFSHVCFRYDSAKLTNYGANWYPNRIGVLPDEGFISDGGSPINKALSLAALDVTGGAVAAQNGASTKGEPNLEQIEDLAVAAGNAAWGAGQGAVLWQIIMAESSGDPTATNPTRAAGFDPTTGAAGLPQAKPATKLGCNYNHPITMADVVCQIKWMVTYITATYGDAATAWQHEQTYHWY